MTAPLLEVDITAGYRGKPRALHAFRLQVMPGEIVGLIGESGSGKSTVALSILRLLEHKGGKVEGRLRLEGEDLLALTPSEMRAVRGRRIALVLQSAASSLNPALRIGTQLEEAWNAHRSGGPGAWKNRVHDLFDQVRLPSDPAFLRRYPREISVGQAQRVLIAMAVLHHPALLIADEPTSALDAITQAEVLKLLRQLNRDLNMAVLYISHDLGSVAHLCDRVAILEKGQIVETGPCDDIFRRPRHPYTRALLEAIPRPPSLDYSVSSTSLSTAIE